MHGVVCRMLVRGLGEPLPWSSDVVVGVVLQLDGSGLRVGLCFEERASGPRALGEVGGTRRACEDPVGLLVASVRIVS